MGTIEWMQLTSEAVAGALISSLWQGILLAAAMWVCLKLAPKTSASVRYFLWMAVFVAIGLLPLLSLAHTSTKPGGMVAVASATPVSVPVLHLNSRWALAMVAIWIVFSLVRAASLLRNAFRLRSIRKSSCPFEAVSELKLLLASAGFRSAEICTSNDVDQPCVIGFFAPRILVPEWLVAKATSEELRQIVLHEVSHLRRLDDWMNLFQKLALVVFPLNPALWWVERRLCSEREAACDESVIAATQAPTKYATCLANLAEERMQRRAVSLSLGAWEKQSELGGRIRNILSREKRLSPAKARAITATLVLATAACAVELGNSSQLVAFTVAPDAQSRAEIQNAHTIDAPASGRYQDVVYRVPQKKAQTDVGTVSDSDVGGGPKVVRTSVQKSVPHLRRVAAPQTLLVVEQWDDSFGQRLTAVTLIERTNPGNQKSASQIVSGRVIASRIQISAEEAAQSQGGWYAVRL